MTNRLMPLLDKLLLGNRALIETITEQLKNIRQIERPRHRSVANFMANPTPVWSPIPINLRNRP